jgi:hypothetical protein
MPRHIDPLSEDELLVRAYECGFVLAEQELDTGQLVFEWRRGNGPGPLFVTRRVAFHWMVDWMRRTAEQHDHVHAHTPGA